MIQCPICQMINEDQTRFCAECGARLGPAPPSGPPVQQGPAPVQLPPQQPAQQHPQQQPPASKLHSPMLGAAGQPESSGFAAPAAKSSDPAEMDRLRKIANRPEVQQTDGVPRNPFDPRLQGGAQGPAPQGPPHGAPQGAPQQPQQAPPQNPPSKKLRSPLLAAEEFDDEPEPGPISSRARGMGPQQGSGRQHLHSPLLGDGGADDDYVTPQSTSGRQGLHSPLLGEDRGHGGLHDAPQQGSGRHLHSPLLGDAGAHGVHHDAPAPQAGSGRQHLHSPLLGGGEEDDEYYEEEAPRRGGGLHSPILGGGGGGGRGLRSPILGGAGGGGDQYYEDDYYDDDPYADEDNPNILRSPLLSAKMPLDHHEHEAPAPQTRPARPQQQRPAQPPQPQQPQQPQQYAQPAQAGPPQQYQGPPQPQQPQYQQAPAAQPQYQQAPQAPAQPPQQPPPQFQAPESAPLPAQMPPQPAAAPAPAAGPPQPPSQFNPGQMQATSAAGAAPKSGSDEAFPDMTQFRRGGADEPASVAGAAFQSSSSNPTPVVPVSLPMSAGIPDPASYVPPESSSPGASLEEPLFSRSPAPAEAPPKETALPPIPSKPSEIASPSKPKLHSKLLDDDGQDDYDNAYSSPSFGGAASNRGAAPYQPPAQPGSPIPKLLGGVAILLALGKVPMLMTYLPAISNPQFTGTAIDLLVTTLAIFALGLSALMSKN